MKELLLAQQFARVYTYTARNPGVLRLVCSNLQSYGCSLKLEDPLQICVGIC